MSNWNIKELSSDPGYRVIKTDGTIHDILYEGETFQGKPSDIFAYLGVPETDHGPVPGMVCVHGGGGKAFRQWVKMWVDRGYAAIAMDLGGRGEGGTRLPNGGPEQDDQSKFNTRVVWQDLWTYHAVAAVIRANTILRGLPSVDSARIGITGISWGGYVTCIAAGVDTRFACAIPVYGCGFLQQGSADEWMKVFASMTVAERQVWHDRCDPSVYLGNAALPMLFVTGTNDFAYPLDILERTCALPVGSVTRCVRVEMPHGHEPGWTPKEISIFADQHLAKGTPLPEMGACQYARGSLKARVTSAVPLRNAHLAYTTIKTKWQDRKWHTVPTSFSEGVVEASVPETVSACFLAIEDERGALVSSPCLIL
ncbi:MAG TPA: acetylxylan esterase [Verrucomicrobia bacterium]|nr:acetylxylan esterase [Verrucomicrobiota bacterium]